MKYNYSAKNSGKDLIYANRLRLVEKLKINYNKNPKIYSLSHLKLNAEDVRNVIFKIINMKNLKKELIDFKRFIDTKGIIIKNDLIEEYLNGIGYYKPIEYYKPKCNETNCIKIKKDGTCDYSIMCINRKNIQP